MATATKTTTPAPAARLTVEAIIEQRLDLGLSQSRLARLAFISTTTMCALENKRYPLTDRMERRLARVLNAYERAMAEVEAAACA